jgi:hypothetical protein
MSGPIEPVKINFLTSTRVEEARQVVVERLRAQGGKIITDSAQKIIATFPIPNRKIISNW